MKRVPARPNSSLHRLVVASALIFSLVAGFWLFAIRIEPSALILRSYYEKFAAATAVETDHYAPSLAIRKKGGQNYGDGGADTAFDVYRPVTALKEELPTVVWIHGGGWLSGSKADVEPYARKIASSRFTVVSVNYPLSPANEFPTATVAINQALKYITDRASLYGIDSDNIILAGNGAGANLASQLAALTTNADYAAQLGMQPSLQPEQLSGVVLNGGIYDVAATTQVGGITGWVTRVGLRAYTGERYPWERDDAGLVSPLTGVYGEFPATWITAGDADPLTQNQAVPFAEVLTRNGVAVSTLFPDAGSAMPPDYQFMLALPQAKRAFASMLDFMHEVTQ